MKIQSSLLFVVMCFSAAYSPAGELLKNGSFEKITGNGVPAQWSANVPADAKPFVRFESVGDSVVCRVANDAGKASSCWLTQEVNVTEYGSYEVSVESLVKTHLPNEEHSCSLGVYFRDSKGAWIGYKELSCFAYQSEKWKSATKIPSAKSVCVKREVTTPAGTAKMGIRLNFSGKGIEAQWRKASIVSKDMTVTDALNKLTVPDLAERPQEGKKVSGDGITLTADWTDDGAVIEKNEKRYSVVLNGLWGFRPVSAKGEWAYVKIPGETRSNDKSTILYGNEANYNHGAIASVCLARTVNIPLEYVGKRFFMCFDGIENLTLRLYFNGQKIGDLDVDFGGEIEIPKSCVKAGKNDVMLIALPRSSHGEQPVHLFAAGKVRPWKAVQPWVPCRIYDVALRACDEKPVFDSVRITPSVAKKQVSVTFPHNDENESLTYSAKIKDKTGKELCRADNLKAHKVGKRDEISFGWENPVLWTPDTPNMLTLELCANDKNGRLADRSLPIEFGFREVSIVGKKMYLNGTELRLRPRMSMIYNMINDEGFLRRGYSFIKNMGFNAILRGSSMGHLGVYNGRHPVRMADELGLFYIMYSPLSAVSSGQFFSKNATDVSPELIDYLDKYLVGKFYNHPSVIAYSGFGTTPSVGVNISYFNQPDLWGMDALDSHEKIDATKASGKVTDDFALGRLKAIVDFVKAIKSLDSSRLFLSHFDCGAGDGWGVFDYFNWTPMQEWEEWISEYSHHGVKPIGSWEHGNPYPQSFVNHALPDGDEEPWVTEYAAMWMGPRAYQYETKDYLELTKNIYDPSRKVFGKSTHHGTGFVPGLPVVQELWGLFNTRLYRSWRLQGANMGIEPFGSASNYIKQEELNKGINTRVAKADDHLKGLNIKADYLRKNHQWPNEAFIPSEPLKEDKMPRGLNSFGRALYKNNGTFLGFVAGDEKNPIAKTHIFKPGEIVRKQIAFVYDGFGPLAGSVKGEVRLGARVIETIDFAFDFTSATTMCRKISFTIPSDRRGTLAKPAEGVINVAFIDSNGKKLGDDAFKFSVISATKPERNGVVLYDPHGTCGHLSEFAGVVTTGLKFGDAKVVVIGEGALTAEVLKAVPASASVLVLEQKAEKLASLGFRVYPIRLREFWADQSFGVDSELLRDWRGGRPFQLGESVKPLRSGYNNAVSTSGMVAETVIETPTTGNFTPLVHGGFDLAQTALLETVLDGRKIIFCQLAMNEENVKTEPAAAEIFNLLVARLKRSETKRFAPCVWGNGELLSSLGAKDIVKDLPNEGIVFVADKLSAADYHVVKAFVERGGTAVVLPQDEKFYSAIGVVAEKKKVSLFAVEHIAGLNAGNGHFRQELETMMFGASAVCEKVRGKGRFVLAGFDPRAIDFEKEPYLRLTYSRQMRTLAQLLTNVGMRLENPSHALFNNLVQPPVEESLKWTKSKIRATRKEDQTWQAADLDDSAWDDYDIGKGTALFIDAQIRAEFTIEKSIADLTGLVLDAGTFDDYDEVTLNGVRIGATTEANSDPSKAWMLRRIYAIPYGLLRNGKNLLTIHCWNRNGVTKGWKTRARGPFAIKDTVPRMPIYAVPHRHCDDPYLLHQW